MYRLGLATVRRSAVGKFPEIVVERAPPCPSPHDRRLASLRAGRAVAPASSSRPCRARDGVTSPCASRSTVEVGPRPMIVSSRPDLCHADVDLGGVGRVAGSDPSTEIAEVLLDQRLQRVSAIYKKKCSGLRGSPFRRSPTSMSRRGDALRNCRAAPGQPRPLETPDPSKGLAVYNRAARAATAASVGFARWSTGYRTTHLVVRRLSSPEQRSGPVSR